MQRKMTAADYYNRGITNDKNGKFNLAIKDYTEAIKLDPKSVDAYNSRGCLYEWRGEYDKAIADFTQTIELDPKNVGAYNSRGCVYQAQGQFNLAIKDYEKAFGIKPEHTFWILFNLYQIFLVIKHGDLDGVDKRTVFSAIKMLPNDDQVQLLKQCIDPDTVLGSYFWKQRGFIPLTWNTINFGVGTLSKICAHLKKLDPTWKKPTSTPSFNNYATIWNSNSHRDEINVATCIKRYAK